MPKRPRAGRFSTAAPLVLAILAIGLLAAACGGGNGSDDNAGANAEQAPPATAPAVSQTSLVGGQPGFNIGVATWEGYWYSRYDLGVLVMMSGLGDTFDPDPAAVMAAVNMVDADPSDGDTVVLPANPALLQTVFASADPGLVDDPATLQPGDLRAFRLDPASFDRTVTTPAMAWTIIKEVEWVKAFAFQSHFGAPSDNFGAQERFKGAVLFMLARTQTDYLLRNMQADGGLFADSNGTIDRVGNWVTLQALADLEGLLLSPDTPFHDPEAAAHLEAAASALQSALRATAPSTVEELSAAIQALTWRAAATTDAASRTSAVADIDDYGDLLAGQQVATAADRGTAIRGLVEAWRVTGRPEYIDRAGTLFDGLMQDFDAAHGIFRSQNVYTAEQIAMILGGLHAILVHGGDRAPLAADILTTFFESAVDMSGLMLAAPPGKADGEAGSYEQDLPSELYYRYPTIPTPFEAKGSFGVAPVLATEVTWDGASWSVTDRRLSPAQGMHLSNELLWLHDIALGVTAFPQVSP